MLWFKSISYEDKLCHKLQIPILGHHFKSSLENKFIRKPAKTKPDEFPFCPLPQIDTYALGELIFAKTNRRVKLTTEPLQQILIRRSIM